MVLPSWEYATGHVHAFQSCEAIIFVYNLDSPDTFQEVSGLYEDALLARRQNPVDRLNVPVFGSDCPLTASCW
jgi:hypothetical protein